LPPYKLHASKNIPLSVDLEVSVRGACMHTCMSRLFRGGQVQSAPQERQISKSVAYPYFSQASLCPAWPIAVPTRTLHSPRGLKNLEIAFVLMQLSLESAPGSSGAGAKENTAGGRCHSRGTCTESPGCICFGMGSKDCREQSSVRAAFLPPVSQTFLSLTA